MRESDPSPDAGALRDQIIATLRTVFDPEIPVNIYELGLIYDIKVSPQNAVAIGMTLTSPNCPVAESLPRQVQLKVAAIPGITDAKVEIVWEPPWSPEKMSEAAKFQLELLGIPDLSHVHQKDRTTGLTIGRKPIR